MKPEARFHRSSGHSCSDSRPSQAAGGRLPAADWVHDDLLAHYAVQRLGPCEGVTEHFFAVGTEKKVQHPLVPSFLQPAL
jgi:hypothetical protein